MEEGGDEEGEVVGGEVVVDGFEGEADGVEDGGEEGEEGG